MVFPPKIFVISKQIELLQNDMVIKSISQDKKVFNFFEKIS